MVGFMDGSRDFCGREADDDSEADEPSPYDSDTENVDLEEFVQSLSHEVNKWTTYQMNDLELEIIGNGFFGDIYKATERQSNDIIVMKTIKKTTKMKLICAEIRLMCRLKHPNILRFLGVCIHDAKINLITKYMDIGNLEQVVLDLDEPLPWSLRMKLAHDISKGMEYLHKEGVIHRDLASKNVLISNESGGYVAVVADFGLAAKIPSRKKRLNVVGSPYWMAPEVIRHDQYNETVDIFSYGIILCEIIGRVQSSPDDIPRTNEYGLDVNKFREQVEGCPPEFLQLAVCCCQLEPESRPPFEITASFLEYIRKLSIIEGSPIKLAPVKCNGNVRRSANIEDWLTDKKTIVVPSTDTTPPYSATSVCDAESPAIANGDTHDNGDTPDEPPPLTDTPCRQPRPNKRNSFFAGVRYKYFRPTVVTEDLVKNTPSKLAGFFNRVLHVQTRHRFDRSRKTRSKSTGYEDASDIPKLRSYRLFVENKDRQTSDVPQSRAVCSHFNELEESAREQVLSSDRDNKKSYNSASAVTFVEPLPKSEFVSDTSLDTAGLTSRSNSSNSSYTTDDRRPPMCISPDCSEQLDFGQKEHPLLKSWPQHSYAREVHSLGTNGYNERRETALPRCHSESNVGVKPLSSSVKQRSLSTCQGTKSRSLRSKTWSFLNLFRKEGKGKQRT